MWQVISPHALHFRSWGGEFVIYNGLSGDTHLLGPAAAHILSKLQQTPKTSNALALSLAPAMQVEMNEEFVSEIDQLLSQLVKLALIEHT